jgi:hypothetical protein
MEIWFQVSGTSSQGPSRLSVIRWTTLKGLAALLPFLIGAILVECVVVVYAESLGVKDSNLLQWSFIFPGTGWDLTLAISPLFHLVPIVVITSLVSSWTYLVKSLVRRPVEAQKAKWGIAAKRAKDGKTSLLGRIGAALSKANFVAYFQRKMKIARPTAKGALVVFAAFVTFVVLFSLFTYPQLIFQTIASAYQNNPSLLNFVRGTGAALSPIGSFFSGVNDAILSASSGFRDFLLSLGAILAPVAGLDNVGKYLVFQNAAAWISGLIVLLYGSHGQRSHRYKRK